MTNLPAAAPGAAALGAVVVAVKSSSTPLVAQLDDFRAIVHGRLEALHAAARGQAAASDGLSAELGALRRGRCKLDPTA